MQIVMLSPFCYPRRPFLCVFSGALSNRRFLSDCLGVVAHSLHIFSLRALSFRLSATMDNFNPGAPKAKRPPPTVFCYICGRQFGTKTIHEPKCLEKWHIENKKLPKSKRRPEPKRPVVVLEEDGKTIDVEATNEAAWQNAQDLLLECEHCGRRFGEDRLEVHQRSCTAENPAKYVGGKKPKGRSKSQPKETTMRDENTKPEPKEPVQKGVPPTFCYICGRPFGSKSIVIHEPKCLEKWHIENKKLPKSKQRAAPKRPTVVLEADGTVDVEATNEAAWDNAQALLVQCEHCGRRFGEDRLEVHQRSCTAENPAKKAPRKPSKGRKERSTSRPRAEEKQEWRNF